MLILTLIWFWLAPAAAPIALTPVEAQGAPIVWEQPVPPPGTPVRVRLEGEVLARALEAPQRLRLYAGDTPVPFFLDAAPPATEAARCQLNAMNSTARGQDLELVLDTSLAATPFNRLEFTFAASDVLSTVSLEQSSDGVKYIACGSKQLLCQKVAGGAIAKLTAIDVPLVKTRYLRLRFAGLAGKSITKIEAWQRSMQDTGTARLPATLFPMRSGAQKNSHLWPIVANDRNALITSLRFRSAATGMLRRASLVRLGPGATPSHLLADCVLASGLKSGGMLRSELTVQLAQPERAQDLALLVYGDEPVMVLSGVEAMARTGALVFIRPAEGEPVVWTGSNRPACPMALNLPGAITAGKASYLSFSAPRDVGAPSVPGLPLPATGWAGRWWRCLAYGLGALLALGCAWALLRRGQAPAG